MDISASMIRANLKKSEEWIAEFPEYVIDLGEQLVSPEERPPTLEDRVGHLKYTIVHSRIVWGQAGDKVLSRPQYTLSHPYMYGQKIPLLMYPIAPRSRSLLLFQSLLQVETGLRVVQQS